MTPDNYVERGARTTSNMGPKIILITGEKKGSTVLVEGEASKVLLVLGHVFLENLK